MMTSTLNGFQVNQDVITLRSYQRLHAFIGATALLAKEVWKHLGPTLRPQKPCVGDGDIAHDRVTDYKINIITKLINSRSSSISLPLRTNARLVKKTQTPKSNGSATCKVLHQPKGPKPIYPLRVIGGSPARILSWNHAVSWQEIWVLNSPW